MRRIAVLLAIFLAVPICSCIPPVVRESLEFDLASLSCSAAMERRVLTSKEELDAYSFEFVRDDVVDWTLARDFAVLWLADSISSEEFPEDSVLMDLPIPIYSPDGRIRYYEFRVISSGEVTGYITAAAVKDFPCPVLYHSRFSGYADRIDAAVRALAASEPSSESDASECLSDALEGGIAIRMVDNGYPNVALGFCENDSAAPVFKWFADLNGMRMADASDLAHMVSYYDFIMAHPELADEAAGGLKAKSACDDLKREAALFWDVAERNRGLVAKEAAASVAQRHFKSGFLSVKFASSLRTSIDKEMIYKAFHVSGDSWHVANYGACGAVSAGFVLDYLQANYSVNASWRTMPDFDAKKEGLYKTMYIGYTYVGDVVDMIGETDAVTLPTDIGNAIRHFSDYKLAVSPYAYPKVSINSNLPGISLRTFSTGGMHYRNVIAYRETGWGPFKWPEFKILDLVDSADFRNGSWETFMPAYHLMNWNVVRK